MSPPETLRPIGQEPDHGHGRLGQFTHSVLAEYQAKLPSSPRLHLGQNILPHPPFPLSSHLRYPIPEGAWENCGRDLLVFLESGAQWLRGQPTPDGAAFSKEHRIMQWMLRVDAIALAWRAPDSKPADRVPLLAAWVTDRSGAALLGRASAGGTAGDIAVSDDLCIDDAVVALLTDILRAQYAWTTAVFGSGPPLI